MPAITLPLYPVGYFRNIPDIYEKGYPKEWYGEFDGDKDGDFSTSVTFSAADFPAGTVIEVKIPECPFCHQPEELCRDYEPCTFDWDKWIEENFS